jgi:hypothetical protein
MKSSVGHKDFAPTELLPNSIPTIRKDPKGHKGNAVIAAIADNAENAKIESAIRLCTRWDLAFPALPALTAVSL